MATLLLNNGIIFDGISIGAKGTFYGKITFDTSMAGYQELLTDPTYAEQVVVMTYPEIGNCGVNKSDLKNTKTCVRGLIIKNYCQNPNHYLNEQSLSNYLKENNIIAISEVDTRKLTKAIKNSNNITCLITTEEITNEMKNNLKNWKPNKDNNKKLSTNLKSAIKETELNSTETTHKRLDIKKVLVIGSGPIVIGQAAEFDYAGVQACRALKEENIEVVLVNSNPATIMTDEEIADKIYIEPITVEALEQIIDKERPNGLIASLGGQTGLNMAMKLYKEGILAKYNVELLGTSIEAIQKAEDREMFKQLMLEIGEPIPDSTTVSNFDDAQDFANKLGFPLIIRPAFTLGGAGGGIATNEKEFQAIVHTGLLRSPINQILIEKSIAGFKEIEFEVMRDANDTSIIICGMENVDPIGIHTGDSIVVAPTQTLTKKEVSMLRNSATKIIKALKIEGGCNVQFALDPTSNQYYVIEVNPRVSRSSALASKATGYPIARVTTKIAIGYHLNEIRNSITQDTFASSEPAIDYVVTKIPKWPFDKFESGDRLLGTKMKATGEVMAIGRTFESSFKKALNSLEDKNIGLFRRRFNELSTDELLALLHVQDDRRIFRVAEAINRDIEPEEISDITKIDKWFISKIANLVAFEKRLKHEELDVNLYKKAKELGFLDTEIAVFARKKLVDVEKIRKENNIVASFKMVDTCAGKYEAHTPYYYSTYGEFNEAIRDENEQSVAILGSGPIRIGQGIEFDYCSVHCAWSIKNNGYKSIMINSNPETLSTDFDVADKLFFEPMNIETIMNVINNEKPIGVVVQFGGQTAINLAPQLVEKGVKILGTSLEAINTAEDRKLFEKLLRELNIPQPKGKAVRTEEEMLAAAEELGFPLLVRPSYVIGGRGMQVVYDTEELTTYFRSALKFSDEHPVLIDQYIEGKEVEIDAISDGEDVLIPGITEHIERAGVHSGDSMAIYPTQKVKEEVIKTLAEYTKKIARALQVKGLMNIQFVLKDDIAYVIEVNPRASRTVPIMSKVTGIKMVDIAMDIAFGKTLKGMGLKTGIADKTDLVCVKVPVFSFQKLNRIDPALAPEMKSTGEVLGIDTVFEKALIKGFLAAGYKFPSHRGDVLLSLNDHFKSQSLDIAQTLYDLGFRIVATTGTHKYLKEHGIDSKEIENFDLKKIQEDMKLRRLSFVINTPTTRGHGARVGSQNRGFLIRTIAEMFSTPCFTSVDTARAYLKALCYYLENHGLTYNELKEYKKILAKI